MINKVIKDKNIDNIVDKVEDMQDDLKELVDDLKDSFTPDFSCTAGSFVNSGNYTDDDLVYKLKEVRETFFQHSFSIRELRIRAEFEEAIAKLDTVIAGL